MPPKKQKKDNADDAGAAPPPVFKDLVITVSGQFSRTQKEIKADIEAHGGKFATTVTKAVTHVISTKEDVELNAKKVEQAIEKGLPVVSMDWLTQSIAQKAKQDESKFDLAAEAMVHALQKKRAKDSSPPASPRSTRKAKKAKKDDDQAVGDTAAPPANAAAPAPAPSPSFSPAAAAPPSPKTEEKKVKVVSKGRAAVDPYSGLADKGHVYEEGNTVYNAMLNQTNISHNNNKFYVIQIIESDAGGEFWVYNRWGRVGEKGMDKKIPCGRDIMRAKMEFEKKFREKTMNNWSNRKNFVPHPGKYTLIEIDYTGEDTPQQSKALTRPASPRSFPASKLDSRVQDIVRMIFDLKMMERVMVEMEFDINKMPLGKLTKKQVMEGYSVLQEIEKALNSRNHSSLEYLTSRFYTLIPHNFGRNRPPLIKDLETLKQKMQMLEALADITIATKIIEETEAAAGNPIDSNYAKLRCHLEPVEKNSDEYKLILKFVQNNQEPGRDKLELLELFKVAREGEAARFNTKKHLGNRLLVWHGSRLTNFAGILSQGLRIAPPEAPASGYRFGKGLYFADIMTLSSMYCRVDRINNPIGLMLLCDTAFGKMYECPRDQYMTKPPAGHDSTWALGRIEPDPKGHHHHPDGYAIPMGKIGPSGRTNVSCHEHQYIVYDEAQTQIKYLLKLKWH